MRLPAETIKEAILHPDREVREAAVFYFADSHSPDPTIMPLVIQAIDRYGLDAFSIYSFDLAQTNDTVAWLVKEIERVGEGSDERHRDYAYSLRRALRRSDPELLKQHFATIDSLQKLDSVSKAKITDRIALASLTADELWDELSKFCAAHDDEMLEDEDYEHGRSVVTALAPYREQFEQQVLQCLEHPDQCTGWLEVFMVRLAGEMKLEAAVSSLVDRLDEPESIACDEAFRALEKIGTDAVAREFSRRYADGDCGFRIAAASIMEKIHSDFSVQTCFDLLAQEQDESLRGQLLEAVLMNFCSEGIEPARQHVLHTTKSPEMLEVRTALLVACKMLGQTFPEFDAWQEDAQHDVEFRRQWYQARYWDRTPTTTISTRMPLPIPISTKNPFFENKQESPPTTFRRSQRIARNDPCPCGSGKKFKKCCYGKVDSGEETDTDHAAALSSVRPATSPQKYPIGTIALYGPDDSTTTKIVAAVIKRENAEPVLNAGSARGLAKIRKCERQIGEFFDRHHVKSVVATECNLGCPHEEGLDFPLAELSKQSSGLNSTGFMEHGGVKSFCRMPRTP